MGKIKNAILLFAAGTALMACNQGNKTAANAEGADSLTADSVQADSLRFEGEIPGADHTAQYVLVLANDSTNGYRLTVTYEGATTATENYTGTKEIVKKDVKGQPETFYKVTYTKNEDPVYFKVVGDSVLRMVNDKFKEAASSLNYDLRLKK
ncbi:copper resistance protein NlpE N-terminal domain-containing protein [Prevotella sp. A2931]|uniref:Copper resistance protein NlpE N-terminal domain-containing protein n=1 Tax=Prevotella illustrans TaxID=2800387 RepID=A0ABS3M601_9BACT|nr:MULTISPECIES: copper resistance protein NlpE N-terminal domain-containing protein [Prevotella]MBO1363593.1 copper resistance protein NlpE N-terminal domain-containing protein [Prevotella illustrans]PTL26220.1 hypothetical protein C3V39_03600 [Prevotella sp. oral taxon 820]